MLEMYLKCLDLHIVLVVHSLKIKKEQKKIKETGESRYIYQNELDKACFQHDMIYVGFKGLNGRTITDNVLHDKAFILLKIQNI